MSKANAVIFHNKNDKFVYFYIYYVTVLHFLHIIYKMFEITSVTIRCVVTGTIYSTIILLGYNYLVITKRSVVPIATPRECVWDEGGQGEQHHTKIHQIQLVVCDC